MIIKDFLLNSSIRTLKNDIKTISQQTLDEIENMCRSLFSEDNWDTWCRFTQSFQELGYEWVLPKGKYAGTFPKRLSSLLYKEFSKKIPIDLMSKIGTIAADNSLAITEYYFRPIKLEHKIMWGDGDFKDSGSCFWGGNSKAKEMMIDHGFYAMQFFTEATTNYGYGKARSWLYPMTNKFIIFNGYGMQLIEQARILSQYLGLSYKKIELLNNNDNSNLLYINGATGYMLGTTKSLEAYDSFDFHINENRYRGYICCNCENDFDEDEITYINHEPYCDECRDESFNWSEYEERYIHHSDSFEYNREYYRYDRSVYSEKLSIDIPEHLAVYSKTLKDYFEDEKQMKEYEKEAEEENAD